MGNFNIHWKGYPHRRLPRIRVASTRATSVRSRSTPPRILTVNSIRLQQERKNQAFTFRRHRGRKSRSSSSAARARKHASQRARQHIQVLGWNSDIASKANTSKTKSVVSSIKEPHRPPPAVPTAPEDILSQTTVIDSTDGACCSTSRKSQPEKLNSLIHVAKEPVYWSINKSSNRKKSSLASSRALSRTTKRAGDYAHVGPLDPVIRRRSYHNPRRVVGKSRTYDSRIDPRILLDQERPTKSFPANPAATTRGTVSRPPPSKSWQGNPELRRILSSKISKSKADPHSATPSMKSVVQSLLSDPASRTPSQRRAIKRFTNELELYLQASKSLPKQNLAPSPSVTTVSAHTIEELRPYRAQLRAAGLAVTTADQLRETSIMAKLPEPPSPPPTPPKDLRYARKSVAAKSNMDPDAGPHHHNKLGSIASFDTGTTVMDFTPPHEKSGPRDPTPRRRSSLSSDHTIMAFTPPHEKPPPQPTSAPSVPPRASTKKSLPWLRKQEPVQVSPSRSPKGMGIVTASTVKTKTRNPSDVLLSFSPTSNPAQPVPRSSGAQSSRKRYKDQAAQTDIVGRSSNVEQTQTPESKTPSFKTHLESPDLNRTLPFASPSPFHRSPLARSPHKSVHEVAFRRSGPQIVPPEMDHSAPQQLSPTRHTLWPVRCTQCSTEIRQDILEPQLESPTEPKPVSQCESAPELEPNQELEIIPQVPAKWSHTCTARSSLECQQCAPPEIPGPALQREELRESPIHSLQRTSRKAPVRTTHWAANLEAEFEDIIQGYHSPEERFMQRKLIQEAIDEYAKQPPLPDPAKNPTQPRLRVRTLPATHAVPKQKRVKSGAPNPPAPVFADTVLPQSETGSSTWTRDSCGISDRAVLRGLHVAMAAACDEDVAKWIEEITGTSIRRFLADLSTIDELGFNTLAGVARDRLSRGEGRFGHGE